MSYLENRFHLFKLIFIKENNLSIEDNYLIKKIKKINLQNSD